MNEYTFLAGTYDLLLNPFLRGMRKRMLSIAKSFKPVNVVDLCCGTGAQLKLFRRSGVNSLTCIDLSDEMLNIAGKGRYAPECVRADAADTGMEEESFDLAVISLALHEKRAGKAAEVITEAHRLLTPGGHLIIGDYSPSGEAPLFAESAIRFIEFMVGGEHFANYKQYMQTGGLPSLIDRALFKQIESFPAAAGGITVQLWQVIK